MFRTFILTLNMNIIGSSNFKCAGSFAIIFWTLFDVCFNVLGKFILNCLHYIYNLFLFVHSRIVSMMIQFKSLRTTMKTDIVNDEILIKNKVVLFQKVPHHITVVINAESPPYRDFVSIVIWCIFAGVSHISFYHHHNGIDSKLLFEHVCKHAKRHIPAIKWGKSFSEDIKKLSKNQINGYSWKPAVTVHIYQSDDWKNQVVDCISDLVSKDCDSIDIKRLDSMLRKSFLAPDPDLCLVAANAVSFFGFPPWYLRITQIQDASFHYGISVHAFLDLLWKYSNCEQRYGK